MSIVSPELGSWSRRRVKEEPRYSQPSYGVADLRCTLVDRFDR